MLLQYFLACHFTWGLATHYYTVGSHSAPTIAFDPTLFCGFPSNNFVKGHAVLKGLSKDMVSLMLHSYYKARHSHDSYFPVMLCENISSIKLLFLNLNFQICLDSWVQGFNMCNTSSIVFWMCYSFHTFQNLVLCEISAVSIFIWVINMTLPKKSKKKKKRKEKLHVCQ